MEAPILLNNTASTSYSKAFWMKLPKPSSFQYGALTLNLKDYMTPKSIGFRGYRV